MKLLVMLTILGALGLLFWFLGSRILAYWDGRDDASIQCMLRESWPDEDRYRNRYTGQRAGLYDRGFRDGVRAYGHIRGNRKRFYGQGESK